MSLQIIFKSRNALSFILKSRQIIELDFLLIFWTQGLSSFTGLGGTITYNILRDQQLTLWRERVHQNCFLFPKSGSSFSHTAPFVLLIFGKSCERIQGCHTLLFSIFISASKCAWNCLWLLSFLLSRVAVFSFFILCVSPGCKQIIWFSITC